MGDELCYGHNIRDNTEIVLSKNIWRGRDTP